MPSNKSQQPGESPAVNTSKPKPRGGAPKGNKNARTHGLYPAKAALKEFGSKAIDRRTVIGRALQEWKNSVLDGESNVSAQREAILENASKSKLMLDSLYAYAFRRKLVRRNGDVIPAVREIRALQDSFLKHMLALGLDRRQKSVDDLESLIASYDTKPAEPTARPVTETQPAAESAITSAEPTTESENPNE